MVKGKFLFAGFLFLMAFAVHVDAAGVALTYWEGNPLQVYPGQQGCFEINLQNGVGEEDLVFELTLGGNAPFVTLGDDEHYVEAGDTSYVTEACYSVPEDVEAGESYVASITARTRSPNVEGGIEVGVGMSRSIPIIIVAEPQLAPEQTTEEGMNYTFVWYLVALLVAAGVAVYFVMKRKK